MAKDENGLHIQTEDEYRAQVEHQQHDLGAGEAHLTDDELHALTEPEWMTAARRAAGVP